MNATPFFGRGHYFNRILRNPDAWKGTRGAGWNATKGQLDNNISSGPGGWYDGLDGLAARFPDLARRGVNEVLVYGLTSFSLERQTAMFDAAHLHGIKVSP